MEPVDQIILNSCELELYDIKLNVQNSGEELLINDPILDAENEKAIFKLPSVQQPGQLILKLGFKGVITDKMKGFYCSKYHG